MGKGRDGKGCKMDVDTSTSWKSAVVDVNQVEKSRMVDMDQEKCSDETSCLFRRSTLTRRKEQYQKKRAGWLTLTVKVGPFYHALGKINLITFLLGHSNFENTFSFPW